MDNDVTVSYTLADAVPHSRETLIVKLTVLRIPRTISIVRSASRSKWIEVH
jgi:hypothetical protein